MHPRNTIGPLSPIGHPLSPTQLSSSLSVSASKSRSRSSTSRRVVGSAGKSSSATGSTIQCTVCLESLDARAFARPQRAKEQGATCRTCVWKTLSRNTSQQDGSPGLLLSSSSSLSSYSECPTSCSVLPSTAYASSPPRRNNKNNVDEAPLPLSLEELVES